MLVIRFQRVGRTNDPAFRLVVTEHQNRPQSQGIELLGSYHPKTKHTILKNERILYWISKGAKLSDTAHNLLVKQKVITGAKRPVVRAKPSAEVAVA
ncbi:MAG: 30S ribosomal protein S16 [Candidatus Sungbacteria bacterium RIFCSPHIGHO2_02_FULL_49_12]|uniref:Small ribosomal subunit protein bS16 n=1 Tax=Candidatus Sungbacteria bacterium RIFCSPHIGHO2_02_FULL_49_12 TaxID=1802271 RepID=A0A1G2KMZ8_9BACT|nr:MAG: 30S ribosomal protein S16 [Candidatus Sungbacteria bacterium RIFCSPHIGHO2_02_FULL_49_12]